MSNIQDERAWNIVLGRPKVRFLVFFPDGAIAVAFAESLEIVIHLVRKNEPEIREFGIFDGHTMNHVVVDDDA